MHRIDGAGHIGNMFTEGDPLTGTPATVVTDDWLNEMQEEIMSVLTAAGITASKGTVNQLLAAVVKKNGDTMTGDLNISGATDKTLLVQGTNNSASGTLDLKGKTSGGTTTHYRAIAGPTAVGFGSISSHPAFISTADTVRLQIGATGLFSALPVGYQSSQQTITNATMLTLAHGLGGTPKHVWVTIICINSEFGYGASEEASVQLNNDEADAAEHGVCVSADATNIYVQKGASTLPVYNKSSPGVGAAITNANWKFIVRANP